MLLSEAAEVFGVRKTTLCYRIGASWPVEKLFDLPNYSNKVNR